MARMKSEFELIEAIARATRARRTSASGIVVGIGDDAAVLRFSVRDDIVVTTDAMVEGRHFKRGWLTAAEIGWRLAAANLSDIAAMGAVPKFALVSLVLPRRVTASQAEQIEKGAGEHLAHYGAAIVGGNVASTNGPLVCDMTLIGTCRRGAAWKRRARYGDVIVIAGALGAAAAGAMSLRRGARSGSLGNAFKKPTPRIDVARALEGRQDIHGAIDTSDGLSSDIIHMCEASRLGCEIDAATLPIPRAVRLLCQARRIDPVEWALHAGEDYALLLSVPPQRAAVVCRIIRDAGVPANVIGRFTPRRGVYHVIENGRTRRFEARGWDHLGR
jgi:thiamine-monophosphate kinase